MTNPTTFEEWLGAENPLGMGILERKYRRRGESFKEFLDRLSGGDPELRELIKEKKFLLGGRTMANRGLDTSASYFNCYSYGFVPDDFAEIMEAAKKIGLTFKAQGGQGLSLSKLRPKGTPIGKDYASDGIVPFMKLYNEVTSATSQGGARKGALLMSLDAWHKEAMDFIKIKSQEGVVEKANLSLEIDDEFMKRVEHDMQDDYIETTSVITKNYSGHEVKYEVKPREVFHALAENSWDWADPGVLFTERLRNYNLMQYDDDYVIETTNPCGEQPLPPMGACCLSSINLSEFVVDPYTPKAHFDSMGFIHAIKVGVRSLDKLIDENYNRHPLKEQQEMSYNYRNIGLGVFGYATMLMKLGFKYGSDKAIELTDSIFGLMFRAAVIASNDLAKELGPFPKYKDCIWDSDIMKAHFPQEEIDQMREYGLRNCSLLSIAPTGTLANLLNESGGCEPEFAMKYTRRTVGMTDGDDTYYEVDCKAAREYKKVNNTDVLPDYFVCSKDIPWMNRIRTQAVMQKHVDTGISSTVNLPNETTIEEIEDLYLEAWKAGLKGITIFRDGCKRFPILSTNKKKSEPKKVGKMRKLTTGCGSLHLCAMFNSETGDLMEIFLNKGSSGGCNNFMIGLSRQISLNCKNGASIMDILDQLASSGVCPSYAVRTATKHDTSPGSSCPVAVGKALKEMWEEMKNELGFTEMEEQGTTSKVHDKCKRKKASEFTVGNKQDDTQRIKESETEKCPVCHSPINHSGGCDVCTNCGWSKCE